MNKKPILIIIIGDHSNGKTTLIKAMLNNKIISKENAIFTKGSKQELKRDPEYVLEQVKKKLKENIEIVALPVRALPMDSKFGASNYGYEYVNILTKNIEFSKVILVELDGNENKMTQHNKNLRFINTMKCKELSNCKDTVYESFPYVINKKELANKIKDAVDYINSQFK